MVGDELKLSDEDTAQISALSDQLETISKGDEDAQYEYPTPSVKDNVFRFFREILNLKQSTKVAFLTNEELGRLRFSIRHYLDLSNYAASEGLNQVESYLLRKAETISGPSMSRKGFWAKLFVTQIKKEQKVSGDPPKGGWPWGKQKEPESET